MPAPRKPTAVTGVAVPSPRPKEGKPGFSLFRPLAAIDTMLRRDEADVLFIAGNVALVAFEIVDWPVALLAIAAHAMARSRFKALQAVTEVSEEVD